MSITQTERFYKQDEKKYEVEKNKELLTWLKKVIKKGYNLFIDIDELQNLINNITYWYEIKYPEKEFEYYEGSRYYDFEKMEKLSDNMNIKQLLYRLPHHQLCLIDCDYRSNGYSARDVYNDKGEIIGTKTILFMSIKRKNVKYNPFNLKSKLPDFLLRADTVDGQVYIDYNLKEYINDKKITLDELLNIFKEKYNNELEFTKLEDCIFNHNCDLELRRRILQLVALKLLYSDKTIPERGYKRAKRFINEFNKKLNLNLNTKEIDKIINSYYTNQEKQELVSSIYINNNEEETSLIKVKNLVKSIFKKQ